MAIKKSLMVAGAVASIGLASAVVVPGLASAETDGSAKTSLVDKLTKKFNLNKDEVKEVFEEHHAEKEALHKQKLEERLDQAVKDGKLTEEQKSKILAKMEELKANRPDKEELKDKSAEERRQLMQQHHDELKKWAEEHDIPEEYLPLRFHIKTHGGPGGGEGVEVMKEVHEE
jgi:hypothetical protein